MYLRQTIIFYITWLNPLAHGTGIHAKVAAYTYYSETLSYKVPDQNFFDIYFCKITIRNVFSKQKNVGKP